jgi:NAD(P)-dependent dehydrogenase (short-subunit alcohol dehydrogenase family)
VFSQAVGTCGPIAPEHDNADGPHGSRALVTGASRGLGKAFAETRLKRSAATVNGAARDASAVTIDGGDRSAGAHHRDALVLPWRRSLMPADHDAHGVNLLLLGVH